LLAATTETNPDDVGESETPGQQRGTQRQTKPSAAAWLDDGTQPWRAIERWARRGDRIIARGVASRWRFPLAYE